MRQMTRTRRYAMWATASVLLGAVGSGAWEYVLKPALSGITTVILFVSTLGLDRFKDGIYREIAQGYHEAPSVTLLLHTYGFAAGACVSAIILMYYPSILGLGKGVEAKETRISKTSRAALIFFLFFAGYTSTLSVRVAYVNAAVAHFSQALDITSPYMSEKERAIMLSQFGQVQSRQDYLAIDQDLRKIAKGGGLLIAKMRIW